MRKGDLPELTRRLTELAEALGGKPPTGASIAVWMDVLAECEGSDVWGALVDWPKSHVKAPMPAEILRVAREYATARRERLAQADREAQKVYGNPLDAKRYQPADGPSPAYLEFKRAMAELKKLPRPGPKDWAYRLKKLEEQGEPLAPVQKANWRAALTFKGPVDDEEARLEREAIQGEA